jgi:hypothetical protein
LYEIVLAPRRDVLAHGKPAAGHSAGECGRLSAVNIPVKFPYPAKAQFAPLETVVKHAAAELLVAFGSHRGLDAAVMRTAKGQIKRMCIGNDGVGRSIFFRGHIGCF